MVNHIMYRHVGWPEIYTGQTKEELVNHAYEWSVKDNSLVYRPKFGHYTWQTHPCTWNDQEYTPEEMRHDMMLTLYSIMVHVYGFTEFVKK